jgi:diguanylate cyclase (GGDEF)-like protein
MVDNELMDIISLCLVIDTKAIDIYSELSSATDNLELSVFWENMSKEEQEHVNFWNYLLSLAKKDMIPQVFTNPDQIKNELLQLQNKANSLLESSKNLSDISKSFLIAYRLEFYLLHTAFATLFHSIRSFDDKKNPEDEYEIHINRFFEALSKFGTVTPELELLGESLQRLWKENKSLSLQSSIDELTGVLNRRGFFNIIKPLSYLAKRNNYNVGIIITDIDHFKNINDTYGHQQGDEVLKTVATILKNNIRSSDVIGRYGGDEFIIYLSAISQCSIYSISYKLRKEVESASKNSIEVSISLGVSYGILKNVAEEELKSLITKADSCLYQAKRTGGNEIVICDL